MKKTAFYNFRLFDGRVNALQDDKILLVQNGRIKSVEPAEALEHVQDAVKIDLDGGTMIPGLIDAHIHPTVPLASDLNPRLILQMSRQVALNFSNCLKYGVTSIRDMASFPKKMIGWRKEINAGGRPGPRIVTALSFMTCPGGVPESAPTLNPASALVAGGQFVERLNRPEAVRRVAERLIDWGADWLKTQYSEESIFFHGRLGSWSDECYQALKETGLRRNRPIALHHTERAGFLKGVEIGVATLEHCALDELDDRGVDEFAAKGVSIIPTLKAMGDFSDLDSVLDWVSGPGRCDFLPEPLRQTINGIELMKSKSYPPADYRKKFYSDVEMFKRGYETILKNTAKIKKAGGRIGVGTDSCGTGLSFSGQYYKELIHLTRAGFSNFEALEAATATNAGIIGLAEDVGTIEPGKYADFVLLKGDPLMDLTLLGEATAVYKSGEKVV